MRGRRLFPPRTFRPRGGGCLVYIVAVGGTLAAIIASGYILL